MWKKLQKQLAWQLMKVRNKKEVIEEARNNCRKVHFASLMDLCHLKNSVLEPQFQKYKGRVVFRGDIVKDDSESYAVFTEQGSSASLVTAAKVMDIISRLPGRAGQAADAVSACFRLQWKMHQRHWKFPKSECPDIWICLPLHWWPKSWSSVEDPVVLLERNLYGHLFGKNTVGKKFRIGNAYSLTEKKDYSCLCTWTIWNWLERNKILTRCGNTKERRWFGRTNIVPWPCLFGLHSKRMSD